MYHLRRNVKTCRVEFHSGPLFMLMIALFGGQISVSIGDGKVGPLLINELLFCQQRSGSCEINGPT